MNKKKRKFKFKHLVFILIICYVGYTLVSQQILINSKNKELSDYNKQIQQQQQMKADLNDKIQFAKTPDYIERMAREKLGLVKPGETVYILDGKTSK